MRRSPLALWFAALLAVVGSAPAPAPAQPPAAPPASLAVPTPGGDVTIVADRLEEIGPERLLVATGNVEVVRGTARLLADRVELNRETGAAVATGRVIFYDGEDRLTGERIDYNIRTGTGVVHQGTAHAPPYYRIAGERMERLDPSRYVVRRGIFTTCEDDPPAWSFRFGAAHADLEELIWGTGGSFWVKNVPLIPFIPFFGAAIRRERQTGFLFPRFGNTSRKGLFAEIPFFWAISDSQDATITFDAYGKRGFGGNLEYRYLISREHHGALSAFYLNESLRDEERTQEGVDEHRGWWLFRHTWPLPGGWGLRTDINGVTDDFVFREYGDPLQERATQRAESNVFLTKSWPTWNLVGNLYWYQDLTTRRPVELSRLPDLRLEGVRQPLLGTGFLYEVESSVVNFVRDVGSDGLRFDVHPRLSRPVPVFGFFTITPFAGGRLTAYDKTVTGTRVTRSGGFTVEETRDEAQLRELFELGADLESRAARIFDLGGWGGLDAVLHSIEPRITYTWLDGQGLVRRTSSGRLKGTRLPQWDAIDAIAETSAFTYTLINRLRARTVAPEGTEPVRWELARLTLGHSYDLINAARPFGDVTGDLIVDPNRLFRFRADAAYNLYGKGVTRANTDLTVTVPRVSASVGTRYLRSDEIVDALGRQERQPTTNFLQGHLTAELTRQIVARVTTNWDLRANAFVENRLALDFRWQCWAFTVEYVARHNDEDALMFSINLLGVGAPIQTGARLPALGGNHTGGAEGRR